MALVCVCVCVCLCITVVVNVIIVVIITIIGSTALFQILILYTACQKAAIYTQDNTNKE
jgi:hypothetical protein